MEASMPYDGRMPRREMKFSDQIRKALADCGETRYSIAKATGLGEPALSKFLHGERGLSLDSLDILAAYLHLEVNKRKAPKKAQG
jgi:transcriptional regulator with XRE-family HTH domain